jgi:predicted enzyme related to lactoylglutathione lyase
MIHPHRLCQLELHSENIKASIEFFTEIFGWPPVPIAIHEYTVLDVPDDCSFGISIVGHLPQEHHPYSSGVVPYFAVEGDMSCILERVEQHGGKQVWGPRPVPGYGQVYCVEDPGGIRIGLYAREEKAAPG